MTGVQTCALPISLSAFELKQLKGPALESFQPQSAAAPMLLECFEDLLTDPATIRRFVAHERAFRATLVARRAAQA